MESGLDTERLVALVKEIIDGRYVHIEEYPRLHEYMTASLVKTGLIEETGGTIGLTPGGEGTSRE